MGRIPMPPPGGEGEEIQAPGGVTVHSIPAICEPSTEELFFDINHSGYLVRFGDGLFDPDIPDGAEQAGSAVGPLYPQVSSGTVIVGFFDSVDNSVYVVPIQLKPACP
jgi:hypothetical protein